jgi:hypothetical protein
VHQRAEKMATPLVVGGRTLRKVFPAQIVKKNYESPEIIRKFEPIRQYLLKEGEDPTITNKGLANIVLELIMFQEKELGVEVC